MAWQWVLLLLALAPVDAFREDETNVDWWVEHRLIARYIDLGPAHFASYSSLWNEHLKREARRAQASAR